MFKGYKPCSDPRRGVPPALIPQGCPGAGPGAVPRPALLERGAPGAAGGQGTALPVPAWLPVPSARGAAASSPASRCHQAACLRRAGQRGRPPLTALSGLVAPPMRTRVLEQRVSEAAAWAWGGCSPAPPLAAPGLAFLSARDQGAVGSRGPACPAAAAGCPRHPRQPRYSSKSAEPLGKFDPC